MGGPSGPMLSAQVAAIWDNSLGPEGPPTKAAPARVPQQAGPACAGPAGRPQLASTAAAPAPLRSRRPTLCPTLAKNRMYR
ncbi:DUF6053 domain-containing protein [Lysobacter enzymogenes]|uniref:DUF6053 domain-containing protein n=1 Tax=Lysobacter enzymogenes TaxID=69 RepID=UPI003D18B265